MDEAKPNELREVEGLQIPKKDRRKFWMVVGFSIIVPLFIILLYLVTFALPNKSSNSPVSPSASKAGSSEAPSVSPTPFAFQEMTIPYLRARNFESSLSELERVSSNEDYTSYLTSYISDGFKIYGQLTRPAGEVPAGGWPAIVFVHGYIPPQNYQTLVNYSSYVDVLARNGFVVFKIDLRGHGNSEGDAGGSYYSSDYIVDVLSAREALAGTDFVNPDKIGLWGHSMAGNVTFRALTIKPDIPALVIWAGAVYSYEDWQKYGISDGSYQPPPGESERQRRRRELFAKYGEFNSDSEFWKQVAGTNYISAIRGAIQLNHAVDDNVVNIGYSRDLARLLEVAGIDHEINEYPSGGHNISGSSFNSAMQNTIDFFKKHLSAGS